MKSALEATEEERQRSYEVKWAEGGSISFLYSYTDLLVNKESNDTASEFVRRKIRATVKDLRTAELLCPNNHPIGTKRLILVPARPGPDAHRGGAGCGGFLGAAQQRSG